MYKLTCKRYEPRRARNQEATSLEKIRKKKPPPGPLFRVEIEVNDLGANYKEWDYENEYYVIERMPSEQRIAEDVKYQLFEEDTFESGTITVTKMGGKRKKKH